VLVGLLFAFCARQQFKTGGSPWGRELVAVLTFAGIILWPVAVYYYVVFPDWSWMYFVDSQRLPWVVSVLVFVGNVVTLLGGYLLGWQLLRARRDNLLYGVGAALAIGLLVFTIVCRGRLFNQGSYADFHDGRALSAGESKLGWALGATGLGLSAALALVCFTLWEQGKRFKS
jgi:hypothetical protein